MCFGALLRGEGCRLLLLSRGGGGLGGWAFCLSLGVVLVWCGVSVGVE
jgi:hypothetical protein